MSEGRVKRLFSVKKAHETQLRLAKSIIFKDDLPRRVRLIAGVDVAYAAENSIGAAVILDYDSLEFVESEVAFCKTRFPYIPTLLSFREIPPTVLAIRKLKKHPDVFLVDGQGYAHPYGCGFACHLGLAISRPTIGVAKSRLFGEPERSRNGDAVTFLSHKEQIVGAEVKTRNNRKPVYVSVGHMISLETAIQIVRHCMRDNCVPEPILKAHETANIEKRKINNS